MMITNQGKQNNISAGKGIQQGRLLVSTGGSPASNGRWFWFGLSEHIKNTQASYVWIEDVDIYEYAIEDATLILKGYINVYTTICIIHFATWRTDITGTLPP